MSRLRLHIAAALLGICAVISSPAFATEVGVVNVKELLEKSDAANSLKKQVQETGEKIQKEIQDKDKDLAKEGKEIEKQRTVLAKDAYEKKAQEFQQKVEKLKQDYQGKLNALREAHAKAMTDIQKKILDVAKEVAAEKKLDIIAQMDMLPYADPKLNVTEDMVKRLNKDLKSIKLDMKK